MKKIGYKEYVVHKTLMGNAYQILEKGTGKMIAEVYDVNVVAGVLNAITNVANG